MYNKYEKNDILINLIIFQAKRFITNFPHSINAYFYLF